MDIKLSAKIILDKDFKTGLRGYSQDEVDQFLDEIIQDYESFEQVLKQKEARIAELEQQLHDAQAGQNTSAQPVLEKQEAPIVQQANNVTNYDILKRLANLEKRVFGDKLYDDVEK